MKGINRWNLISTVKKKSLMFIYLELNFRIKF